MVMDIDMNINIFYIIIMNMIQYVHVNVLVCRRRTDWDFHFGNGFAGGLPFRAGILNLLLATMMCVLCIVPGN